MTIDDARRVYRVLRKLTACGIDYAVTGGIALEAALGTNLGRRRALNDIDVVISGFEGLPAILGREFLISHAHPHRPVGKLILQLVDPSERVRIDIFGAYGGTLERARTALVDDLPVKTVALQDIACRIASEMMCFSRGDTVPPKCADDHERAKQIVDIDLVEKAWEDHRRPIDPLTYAGATVQITDALERRTGKLEKQSYSTDADAICPHCRNTLHFTVESPKSILPILGYC
ncbi:hypothetical protein GFB56_16790 [Ensifer sp. T173]|uniref:Nucleotidyltransferase AbiEii toxin of type IV toxin-antitoxin system n=1 Tax=Ensifer canadensis TaxID=555315 RepID=A0AAW4FK89_9HYPH|nr:hypothetical protein [Ensifer canadensis]MBM3092457.1 hypothetical protein [Ensifer canadensis]UBI73977.1 nucleotidyltransferase [Ensifer canadensis]